VDEALRSAPLLCGMAPGDAELLAAQFITLDVPKGIAVFADGEVDDFLYVVLEGKVKLTWQPLPGREVVVSVLGAGDQFGESSLFDPKPRTITATTITATRLAKLPIGSLRLWVQLRPEVSLTLLRLFARRLRYSNAMVADVIALNADGRVRKHLLALANRFGLHENGQLRVQHDLTQQELAQLIGISRESVSKTMAALVRAGCINVHDRSVVICDPERILSEPILRLDARQRRSTEP
jgi:CRP/FNR family transcriptional regulator, cyclic AMP receptor protein